MVPRRRKRARRCGQGRGTARHARAPQRATHGRLAPRLGFGDGCPPLRPQRRHQLLRLPHLGIPPLGRAALHLPCALLDLPSRLRARDGTLQENLVDHGHGARRTLATPPGAAPHACGRIRGTSPAPETGSCGVLGRGNAIGACADTWAARQRTQESSDLRIASSQLPKSQGLSVTLTHHILNALKSATIILSLMLKQGHHKANPEGLTGRGVTPTQCGECRARVATRSGPLATLHGAEATKRGAARVRPWVQCLVPPPTRGSRVAAATAWLCWHFRCGGSLEPRSGGADTVPARCAKVVSGSDGRQRWSAQTPTVPATPLPHAALARLSVEPGSVQLSPSRTQATTASLPRTHRLGWCVGASASAARDRQQEWPGRRKPRR